MKSKETNFNITFEEKVAYILYPYKEYYTDNLITTIDTILKQLLTSRERLKLRARLNIVTYEKIINKEYIFSLDVETIKILKKLKKDDMLKIAVKNTSKDSKKVG